MKIASFNARSSDEHSNVEGDSDTEKSVKKGKF